jgi:VCBS repeat-containing protein
MNYPRLHRTRVADHISRSSFLPHLKKRFAAALVSTLLPCSAFAGTTFYNNQASWQAAAEAALGSSQKIATTASVIADRDQDFGNTPGNNEQLGPTLTFNHHGICGGTLELQTLQSGAGFTFNDTEGGDPVFAANSLSIGDIDNHEDDDFSVRVPSLRGVGFYLVDNTLESGETLTAYGVGGTVLAVATDSTSPALPGYSDAGAFVGFVSTEQIVSVVFNEGSGSDDMAIKDIWLAPALAGDADSDGLSDCDEVTVHKSEPAIDDTDSDDLHDGSEVANAALGYNLIVAGVLRPGDVKANGNIVGPGVDSTAADLSGANLTGVDLTAAKLAGADLTAATLTAVFGKLSSTPSESKLPTGYFIRNAYIVGPDVNLTDADLTAANLADVDLSAATLTGVFGKLAAAPSASALPTVYFIRNDYIVGPDVNLTGANLTGADLTGADLTSANLTDTDLTDAILTGVFGKLSSPPSESDLPTGYFIRNDYIVGPYVNLTGANLAGADLAGVNLTGANLAGAELAGVNLIGATLAGVSGQLSAPPSASALPPGYVIQDSYIVGPTVFSGDTSATGSEDAASVTGSITATDPDDLAASDIFRVKENPSNGVASIAADGSWSYTPKPDFNGVDTFTITATDAWDNVTPQVIMVTVTAVNDVPTAVDVFAATQRSTSASPQSARVVLEGADIDVDALTYRIVSGPTHGNLTDPDNSDATVLSGDIASQSITYTPAQGFTGTDTLTYRVYDGTDVSPDQTATITVFVAYGDSQRQLGEDIDGATEEDRSGTSVALSSDGLTVAIGASYASSDAVGHVRVYRYNGSSWSQLGADIDGEVSLGLSGSSVALSSDGQTVAIGGSGNQSFGTRGRVRVYHYLDGAWIKRGDDMANAQADSSVALSSDGLTLAIGDPSNDDNGNDAGEVRAYRYIEDLDSWIQLGQDIDGEAERDRSGWSVALSSDGQTLAIGAPGNSGNGSSGGHVRVYRYTGSTWIQQGADIDGEKWQSGTSVALSSDGQTVAIGAPYIDGYVSGQVRVYHYNGSNWIKRGADIEGEATGCESGTSVALSSDGRTLAVGAPLNNCNGDFVGQVRVYRYHSGLDTWLKLGHNIDGEATDDESGTSVALSSDGRTVAIGAPLNSDNGRRAGHVRVYDLTQGNAAPTAVDVFAATQQATSESPQSARVTLEGTDIDVDALTYRIVSGPANGSLSDPGNGDATVLSGDIAGQSITYTPMPGFTGTDTLTYRVYDGTDVSTDQTATITVFAAYRENQHKLGDDIDGEAASDESGNSVALSSDGRTVAIGAPRNGDAGRWAGQVRVYRYTGSTWSQLGADIDAEAAGDLAGWSVALSSDGLTVAVGAISNGGAGHVRVYRYTGSSWIQLGDDIDGEATGDYSGSSVALSSDGQNIAIGAPGNDGAGAGVRAGHVRVYRYTGSTWRQLGADIDGEAEYDSSGTSVALSSDGQTLAIAAVGANEYAGQVRVYRYTGSSWIQLGDDIDGKATSDSSGKSVALSSDGQTLAIGASSNDDAGDRAGQVRVYRYTGSTWSQLGTDIDGEASGDESGTSVTLAGDGQTVAVGAHFNDGNGSAAGHVRVYRYTGGNWIQLHADIDGEAADDRSGGAVALSSDGQTVAIGATNNNGTGAYSGHVRVYDLTNLASVLDGDVAGMGSENGGSITGAIAGTDPDGLAASEPYNVAVNPANGVASIAADGSWSYTPNTGFSGIDTFVIAVRDALGAETSVTITLTVTPDNHEEPVSSRLPIWLLIEAAKRQKAAAGG